MSHPNGMWPPGQSLGAVQYCNIVSGWNINMQHCIFITDTNTKETPTLFARLVSTFLHTKAMLEIKKNSCNISLLSFAICGSQVDMIRGNQSIWALLGCV